VSYNVYTYFHYGSNNCEILTAGWGGGPSVFIPTPIQKRGYSPDPPLQSPSEANRRQAGKEIHITFIDLERSVPRSKPPATCALLQF